MKLSTPRWWYVRERPPMPVTRALLTPLSWVWGAVTARKIARARPVDPGATVVCVGNLTMGGTGKTPVAREILRRLSEKGLAAHALSRGYGGSLAGPVQVDPLRHTAAEVGDEPLMLAGLGLVAGVALIAESIGLSLAVAAFIVGMVVAESNYRHHLADELRPLRDIFLGLFFLTIGMSVDWSIVITEPVATAGALLVLVLVKFAIVFALVRLSGAERSSALRTALILAHGGEISLLILMQAIGGGLLPEEVAQPAMAGTAVSIFLAPFLIQFNRRISAEVLSTPQLVAEPDVMIGGSAGDLRGHVILAGCGPVGRLVGTVLKASGIPYIAIERDVDRLRIAHREGHQVIFGDATRRGVLEAANIDTAAVVVALLNSQPRLEQLVRQVRQLNPALPVLVSTRDNRGLTSIAKAGATYIFPENLAAGLGLAVQTFVALGVSPEEALARVRAVRLRLNPELRALRTI